ncbi:N-acetylmuramoyl-L-alanine amidase [Sphingosinicella microcystinivorans]|uniref:N-acetylmuramoyl-L-alanine amidase n=1 Tax=Sphingosinicella microcystinivorans TaxID=335406 RepID=A0AAD1G1K8_SPHMI|nr:N-acetylmuramoyl-L-alanine amidase [Sphingosinicella microcystinivorans]RKS91725.1 N-acetylmuramoyl-L-alanine amidase [Sphingosinicella microcystinivorans]BBE34706.1 N-acetylmuramoyl-L-alanine amidase [Sphingosinicella microcystinivorans]
MSRWLRRGGQALCAPLIAACITLSVPAMAARLGEAAVTASGENVIVTINAEGAGRISTFALSGPPRLAIDLDSMTASGGSVLGSGIVLKVRNAQFDADTARLVVDLASPARIISSNYSAGKLKLTVAPTSEAAFAKLVASGRSTLIAAPVSPQNLAVASAQPAVPAPMKPAASAPEKVVTPTPKAAATVAIKGPTEARPAKALSTPPQRPRLAGRLPVVVIDAGHGGKDVGTISVLGAKKYEKDVVLAIAKAIKKELDASGRVKAILTRDDDTYLRHRDRFGIARHSSASLFISVHADSAPVPNASGATVYTLSETASDAEAARLAAKENRSDIIAGVDLAVETNEVTDILIDLAQRETMNTSAEFAAILQREMREDIKVRSQFHRFAGFLVLKAPDVPSVLLETGYLSNEEDSKFLFSTSGQQRIAKAVRRAVEAHFLRRLAQR